MAQKKIFLNEEEIIISCTFKIPLWVALLNVQLIAILQKFRHYVSLYSKQLKKKKELKFPLRLEASQIFVTYILDQEMSG